ncbi:MAG: cell division protein FtsZ [Methyloligellaceae bacterium]
MSIKINVPDVTELKPKITVVGVGGAGGNAINNMIATGLTGVDFIAANTDAQALAMSSADHRLQMGINLTEGLGAGSHPEIGEAAAQEAIEEIKAQVAGSHMVFVACGMGGGTGTGAAPVIAGIAKEQDILTVGVVTKPFEFEGRRRMRAAEDGIKQLKKNVDTLIVIPNQNLFRIATEKTTFADAFKLADQVLHAGIACITDLILKDGLINLDFADVRTVMSGMGTAMMGTGEALGERRALQAAEEAISNPLLDNITLRGARGLLISITGGADLTLYEVDEAASRIREDVDVDANIIVGATYDHGLDGKVRVSIVASGVDQNENQMLALDATKTSEFIPSRRNREEEEKEEEKLDIGVKVTDIISNSSRSERKSDRKRDDWDGPGDVSIVNRPPGLKASSGNSFSDSDRDDDDDDWLENGDSFVPGPPRNIKRSSRAMPTVEDFPEIVQQEFRSKRGFDRNEESGDKKKRGFFERLASVGRATVAPDSRYKDDKEDFDTYEKSSSRRSGLSHDDENVNEDKESNRRSRYADGRHSDSKRDSKSTRSEEEEINVNIEIPDFLRREV